MFIKHISIALTALIFLGATLFVAYQCRSGGVGNILFGTLFFLPFYSFPLIVNLVLSFKWKYFWSHVILAVSSLLYGLWFAYAMYDAFYVHLDPQSALIILFVGIYSLPVMVPAWIVASLLNSHYIKKNPNPETTASTPLSPAL